MADDFGMGYALGQDSGGSGGGFFGNEGLWAVIILAIIFGWGRNGFGGDNGGGNGMSVLPYLMSSGGLGGADTRAAISDGFAMNNLQSSINGVQQGLCDGFYAVQGQLSNIAAQAQACCCETKQVIQNVGRDLLDNNNANTRAILDFLTQDKLNALRDENQTLKFAASQQAQNAYIAANQEAQTAELIRRLRTPEPIPSYLVPNPNCCYGNPVNVRFGGYGNDGCCGCTG